MLLFNRSKIIYHKQLTNLKHEKILLSLAFLAGVSLTVSAQFKIGGKTINTKKVINAATDVAHAATLSDEDVAKMAKEYIQWMDTHNEVAGPDTEMGQRLERLTANVKKVSGLDLNFKVNAARKSKVDDNTARMQSIKQLGV